VFTTTGGQTRPGDSFQAHLPLPEPTGRERSIGQMLAVLSMEPLRLLTVAPVSSLKERGRVKGSFPGVSRAFGLSAGVRDWRLLFP
jgi:hypothetical protein